MAQVYDAIDIRWNWNGDFIPGQDGDFADSSADQLLSLVDQIQSIVQADLGDWEEHPTRAASLSDYVGEPNTREVAKKIKDRVLTALSTTGTVNRQDMDVRILPIDAHSIVIIIRVLAVKTPNNSLRENQGVTVALVFDYLERNVMPLDRTGAEPFFT